MEVELKRGGTLTRGNKVYERGTTYSVPDAEGNALLGTGYFRRVSGGSDDETGTRRGRTIRVGGGRVSAKPRASGKEDRSTKKHEFGAPPGAFRKKADAEAWARTQGYELNKNYALARLNEVCTMIVEGRDLSERVEVSGRIVDDKVVPLDRPSPKDRNTKAKAEEKADDSKADDKEEKDKPAGRPKAPPVDDDAVTV